MAIILASGSPRRKELLSNIVHEFKVIVSDADESADTSLPPEQLVVQLAKIKAEAVLPLTNTGDTVIAADTVVWIQNKILGKPHSVQEADKMLSLLSGAVHTVFTGVYISDGKNTICFSDKTEVEFYSLTQAEKDSYIATKEPFDKAGGYGIQGKGSVLVKSINGDFYNVMGFPVARVYRALKSIKAI